MTTRIPYTDISFPTEPAQERTPARTHSLTGTPAGYPGGQRYAPDIPLGLEGPVGSGVAPGALVPPEWDNYWFDSVGRNVPVGTPGATHRYDLYISDLETYRDLTEGPGARGGDTGVSASIAAQAQNLGTYVSAAIASVQTDIDAKRLSTEQAMNEFNRRLDAMAEAGAQFTNLQQYTVPRGSAGQPLHGALRESLGLDPWISDPIQYDPFAEAQAIVDATPDLTEIGTGDTSPIEEALDVARSFV